MQRVVGAESICSRAGSRVQDTTAVRPVGLYGMERGEKEMKTNQGFVDCHHFSAERLRWERHCCLFVTDGGGQLR